MPLKMHLTKLMEKLEMHFQIHGKIKNAFSKIRNAFPYFGNAFFMEMKMHMENPHLFSLRFQKFISKIKKLQSTLGSFAYSATLPTAKEGVTVLENDLMWFWNEKNMKHIELMNIVIKQF